MKERDGGCATPTSLSLRDGAAPAERRCRYRCLVRSNRITALDQLAAELVPVLGEESADALGRVLDALARGADAALGANLLGVYLTGSFALGSADPASDVDFLVVAASGLTERQELTARDLHRTLRGRPEEWAHHLDGSWVAVDALLGEVGSDLRWLYVDNGSSDLRLSGHDDTFAARWVLRHGGRPLVGPQPADIVREVAATEMRAEAVTQADARHAWLLENPDDLDDGWAQPYAVLTHCRLVWTAEHGTVAGKADAARWVRDHCAPEEFRSLLSAAIQNRLVPVDRNVNAADPGRAALTVAFIRWVSGEVHRRASGPRGDA